MKLGEFQPLPVDIYTRLYPELDLNRHFYLRPLSPYHGGELSLNVFELIVRFDGQIDRYQTIPSLLMDWAKQGGEDLLAHFETLLERLQNPVQSYGSLNVGKRPHIMGIVNVTPDSFSDGGDHYQSALAIAHGKALFEAGADILDVGGESTRPGAAAVSVEEELNRVVPVIKGLKPLGAKISVDTRHRAVMDAAIRAGADFINDVTALEERGAVATAVGLKAPVMIMHMQGEPQTMQANPVYDDCVLDIYDYLQDRIRVCKAAGLDRTNICVDPGIGFGKTLDHNMAIMNQLSIYHGLGCAVLLGASRKSFIPKICGDAAPKDRVAGSLAAALKGVNAGAQFVRVHDVMETKQAIDVWLT